MLQRARILAHRYGLLRLFLIGAGYRAKISSVSLAKLAPRRRYGEGLSAGSGFDARSVASQAGGATKPRMLRAASRRRAVLWRPIAPG